MCLLSLYEHTKQRTHFTDIYKTEIKMVEPVIIVHGGAGDIPENRVPAKIKGVKLAASLGYKCLNSGGSILDAIEVAVRSMEDDEAFNAGYGSVLNLDAAVEMEASMQRGSDLQAGCVTLIRDIRHPISIARRVLEKTPHAMLGGDGARSFAISEGFETVPPSSLVTDAALQALEDFLNGGGGGRIEIGHKKDMGDGVGTVGAVAIDSEGRIAVATSTGGMTGKYVGRIGDTPQIGSGTYADDKIGGVSTTGHGETILKVCLAHSIIIGMEKGLSPQEATTQAIDAMTNRLTETAGAITLSNKGDIGMYFSSKMMAWCYVKAGKIHYGIKPNEHNIEDFDVNAP
ncbi:putative isoaspartyl peptidase/L-asparaginase GA20639 isoform X1 [Arctopsyche grandis]|uniref:putative isoaspartyl peptidase/L-asparaginase GA20639 isoform X1 n=2 Tax=Arctopsyche grandis TaxID=121162 RepID=UPI00406D773F